MTETRPLCRHLGPEYRVEAKRRNVKSSYAIVTACCNRPEGHSGDHMDIDPTTFARRAVWSISPPVT